MPHPTSYFTSSSPPLLTQHITCKEKRRRGLGRQWHDMWVQVWNSLQVLACLGEGQAGLPWFKLGRKRRRWLPVKGPVLFYQTCPLGLHLSGRMATAAGLFLKCLCWLMTAVLPLLPWWRPYRLVTHCKGICLCNIFVNLLQNLCPLKHWVPVFEGISVAHTTVNLIVSHVLHISISQTKKLGYRGVLPVFDKVSHVLKVCRTLSCSTGHGLNTAILAEAIHKRSHQLGTQNGIGSVSYKCNWTLEALLLALKELGFIGMPTWLAM